MSNKTLLIALILVCALGVEQKCDPSPQIITNARDRFQLVSNCPSNAHCLENGWCACDEGFIGSCTQPAYRLADSITTSATITNQTYTFFEVLGNPDFYNMLSFILCHEGGKGLTEKIDVWDDDGTTYIFDQSNAQQGGKSYEIKEGCVNLQTPFIAFGTKSNGETQGFILGLKLNNQGLVSVSLTLTITLLDFWGLMTKLLFIIGGCFLLTLSIAIAYLVYKWRRRQQYFNNLNRPKNLSHFDRYMPKVKLSRQQREKMNEQICSVCLLELGDHWLRKTVCGHIFHQDCLDQWCKANLSCPICRHSFELADLRTDLSTVESINGSQLRENILV